MSSTGKLLLLVGVLLVTSFLGAVIVIWCWDDGEVYGSEASKYFEDVQK